MNMKIIIEKDLDFPSLGRFCRKGEIEVSEEEAKVLLTSPHITINNKQNGTYRKIRRARNRS